MTAESDSGGRVSPRIGIVCNHDHDVFSVVGERLRERGYAVCFFEPGRPIAPPTIDGLDLLANKKVDPESFRALRYAGRSGVATWNGYTTVVLGARPVGLRALAAVGFRVPATTFEKPAGSYVAKTLFDWHFEPDPVVGGDGAVYQELLDADPFDDKYYAIDDGDGIDVTVLRTTSKLRGEKEPVGEVDPDPRLADNVRRLMERTDTQAIGVDVVHADGDAYAVDVNPAMSFRHADREAELADSMAARLRPTADPPARSAR